MLDDLKKHIGSILLGVAATTLIGTLAWLLVQLLKGSQNVVGASLPIIAIGGMMLLILLLAVLAIIFSILGLANKDQAMGLPEGSVRAVISLSLIVLFAILSVFLYKNVATNSPVNTIINLTDAERKQLIRDLPNARDVQSSISKKDGKEVIAKDSSGNDLKHADGTPHYLYDVRYRSTNQASDDFAKQLLVLLGTLMTAVSSFYLGAGTATSAAVAGQTAAQPPSPSSTSKVSGISPATFEIAKSTLHLEISGTGLNTMTHLKIIKGTAQLIADPVTSNATRVIGDVSLAQATAGSWDVVIDDGGGNIITLPNALTLT